MRSMTRGFCALLAVALATGCAPEPTKQIKINYAEKRATLDNGLKLVIIPDRNTPMVQVDVRYAVGANEDPVGKAGLAHYVEHMMFQWRMFGADGPDLFTVMPQITTGMNAYTAADRTHYWLQAPKEDVAKLLDLEARRMRMAATGKCMDIPDAEFPRELDVVRNEIRRQLGTANGLIGNILLEEVYPKGHPYSHTPGGNDQNLVSITKKDVCDFMARYYSPSRATLLVAGNVNPDEIGKLVNGYFAAIPKGEAIPRKKVQPNITKKKRVEKDLDIERTTVAIAWGLPPKSDPDSVKGELAAASISARAARLAADWDFASSAGATVWGGDFYLHSPTLVLFAELNNPKDVDKALDYLWKAIDDADRGVQYMGGGGEDEIARARAAYIMNLEPLQNRTQEVANLIQFGSTDTKFNGGGEYILDHLRKMDQVKSENYKEFIQKNLSRDRAVTFVFNASKSGLTGDTRAAGKLGKSADHYAEKKAMVDPNEAQRPVTYPKEPGIITRAERYTLKNGMNVVLLPYTGLPVVSFGLRFGVGSAHEDPAKAGLASMACAQLRIPQMSDAMARIGAQTSRSCGMDSTSFNVRVTENVLPEAIQGLERWITAGDYIQEAIEGWQAQYGKNVNLASSKASRAYQMAVATALYGADHPYTTNGSPTPETFKKFGRDMLQKFRKEHYTAGNATLIMAGQFDVEEAKKAIQNNFGGWSKGREDKPVKRARSAGPGQARYVGVVGLDKQNTRIQIAYPATVGIDGDYGLRRLASTIINGRMGLVRTVLGSTYGVGGGWGPAVGQTVYRMGGAVESMRAGESLAFMRKQLEKLREGENFDIDFVRARRNVMKKLLGRSTESYSLAAALGRLVNYELAPDFDWQTIKKVATAKPDEVKNVIMKDLDPSREIIVLMADKDTLKKTFEAIGVTEYELIDVTKE